MDDKSDERYGVPDAENPEWSEAEFADARRWQPGDPVSSHAARLEAALRKIVRAAEARDVDACGEIARKALG